MNKNYFFQAAVLLNRFSQDLIQIYGQSVHFHRCVRKRQSSCQMQRLIKQHAKLFCLFPSRKAIGMNTKKTGSDLQSIDPVFRFEAEFFPSLFTIIYARFFLTSPSPKNESKTAKNPNPATGTFSSEPKAGYAFYCRFAKFAAVLKPVLQAASCSACDWLVLMLALHLQALFWHFPIPAGLHCIF